MARYVLFFSYTSETWARMIGSPGDRTKAVREVVESLGGSLESLDWMLGPYDGMSIAEFADSTRVAAVSAMLMSTGAFKSVQTHELLTQDQLVQAMGLAGSAGQAYRRPGQA